MSIGISVGSVGGNKKYETTIQDKIKGVFALQSLKDGKMAIYWDRKVAEDERKPYEEIVKTEIRIWKSKI